MRLLDLVILRFAVRVSGITQFALSRMDTLGGIGDVKVCVAYKKDGKLVDNYPGIFGRIGKNGAGL